MDADEAFLQAAPEETLFAYFLARPRQSEVPADQLALWTREETERERAAQANGGEYYPRSLLSQIYHAADTVSLRPALTQRWPRVAAAYSWARSFVRR